MRLLIALPLLGACATAGTPPPAPPPARVHEHAGPPPPAAEPRIITGRVLDAATRQPLDGAAVDVMSPAATGAITVTTGPDGVYRTTEIPPGPFQIRCRRTGYAAITRDAEMSDGTAHLDFGLVKQ